MFMPRKATNKYVNIFCFPVALNHQTNDKYMDVNRAMFELNGGFGYIPKPDCLLKVGD